VSIQRTRIKLTF